MAHRLLLALITVALLIAAPPGIGHTQQQLEGDSRFRKKWNEFAQHYNRQTALMVELSAGLMDDPKWQELAASYNKQTGLMIDVRESFDADPPELVQSLDVREKMREALTLNKHCRKLMIELIEIQFNEKVKDK